MLPLTWKFCLRDDYDHRVQLLILLHLILPSFTVSLAISCDLTSTKYIGEIDIKEIFRAFTNDIERRCKAISSESSISSLPTWVAEFDWLKWFGSFIFWLIFSSALGVWNDWGLSVLQVGFILESFGGEPCLIIEPWPATNFYVTIAAATASWD